MNLDNKIKQIQSNDGGVCITVAIPTIRVGDYQKNRIRWKNAIQEVEKNCQEFEVSCEEVVNKMESYLSDSQFWANQGEGLVFYYSENMQELIVTLNHDVVPMIDISSSFNIYPLISEKQASASAFVFCVSKNDTRLFSKDGGELSEVDISANVVENYEEAMNFDDPTKSLQHHSVGGGDAYFHGNGAVVDNDTVRTEQYLRRVDEGLMEVIGGHNTPLILACVEEYLPIYTKISNYPNIHSEIISGNPDYLTASVIHDKVNCILTEDMGLKVNQFLNQYYKESSEELQISTVEALDSAVFMKNVDRILVNESQLKNLAEGEIKEITRSIANAYNNGAKILCINDPESDQIIYGVKRFMMESAYT